MRNHLIALSLVSIFLGSAWAIKTDVQAKKPVSPSVSIAQVFISH